MNTPGAGRSPTWPPGTCTTPKSFSVVQRKVLTPNDFADLDDVADRLLAFQAAYEAIATPFQWKFTRSDLASLLERLPDPEALRPAA